MKCSKLLSALLAAVLLFGRLPNSVHAAENEAPISSINGSFIQPWLYASWDDERWRAEMEILKETGIDYLIMGDVANKNQDGSWTVYYESELDFLDGYFVYNAIDSIMYYCDQYDIKLYLGMGLDTAWNSDLTIEEGLSANREYMERCNRITTELYERYKPQYPDTYYGFYFVTELYNTYYMETDYGTQLYTDGLDEMFTMVIEHCNSLNPDMPLLFSPYVNIFGYGYASINVDRFTEFWTQTLTKIPFRDGDILCPQDSCGGGGNDVEHLEEWMAAYRNAVDRANAARGTNLLLGTNAEMFVSPDAYRMTSPHGVNYVGIKTVDDFAKRLEIAQPYVDTLWCFAYSHHYSPYNVPEGFHHAFTEYLRTGEIEQNPPTPPTIVKTEVVTVENAPHLQISFSGMQDDTEVGQINIYKNGFLYDYLVPGVNNGKTGQNHAQNVWIDYEFDTAKDSAVYEFEVVDVCGNVSEKSAYTVTPQNVNNGAELDSGTPNTDGPTAWEHDALDYLSYTVTDSGVRITGCEKSVTEIVIPDTIEGKPVTVIDWYAFENCKFLKSVVLPDTITHISRYAFVHCISLESINMPASLYAIEQSAFQDCPKLNGIQLPSSLAVIEQRAFSECESLTDVTIPQNCKQVGDYAFFACADLSTIKIESTDTEFGTCSMGYIYQSGYCLQTGFTIDAQKGSAVSYAQENDIPLKQDVLIGDVDLDGAVTVNDAVLLQKYLLVQEKLAAAKKAAADITKDHTVNAFDLTALKRMLLT
ncbi:MAG: DUF4434 domain-containing protein [Oscillospiraceae bacterium]|nr:DUF4434 domain-containing protein [Oscillospiraceae bacterium]